MLESLYSAASELAGLSFAAKILALLIYEVGCALGVLAVKALDAWLHCDTESPRA